MPKKTLLLIAHTPSINTVNLANAVYNGILQSSKDGNITNIELIQKSPQDTSVEDVLTADALILGTTENIGYMAGLTKDFFDRCYNSLLEKKQGMPYAIYIRAGFDGTATRQALVTINNGLKWNMVQEPLILRGSWNEVFLDQARELGLSIALGVDLGIF